MRASEGLFELLEELEGCVLHVYKDQAGLPTIGIGHLLRNGEVFPGGCTKEKALYLLKQDVASAENCVDELVTGEVSQNQFDAMVSLAFNIGNHGFAESSVLKHVNAGEFKAVPKAFRMWNKITVDGKHVVSDGLVARREAEIKLWEA